MLTDRCNVRAIAQPEDSLAFAARKRARCDERAAHIVTSVTVMHITTRLYVLHVYTVYLLSSLALTARYSYALLSIAKDAHPPARMPDGWPLCRSPMPTGDILAHGYARQIWISSARRSSTCTDAML